MNVAGQIKRASDGAQTLESSNLRALKRRLMMQILTLLLVTCGAAITGMLLDQQMDNFLPESKTLPSVFNHKPSGTSGILEVADKAGFNCKEWVFPYRQLPSIKGALIIISPSESLAEFEAAQILNWVKEGNDLVYLDHFAYKMTRHLIKGLDVDAQDCASMTDLVVPLAAGRPEFSHVNQLTITADTRLTGAPPLVTDKDGGVLFAVIKHGRGHILLGTVPSLVSNRRLTAQQQWQNFQFFINWLRTTHGEIWFDERCHGFSKNANVFIFLGRGPTGAVFMQLLLMLAIAVLSAGQRFGRTESLVAKRKMSSLEFIYGLSNAYKRARANTATLEIIGQAFRTRLCKLLAVSPHESDEHLLASWSNSLLATEQLRQPVTQFLSDYQAQLQRRNLSDNELKALIVTCDKITEQLKSLQGKHLSAIGQMGNDEKNI